MNQQNDVKDQIWNIVKSINRICKSGTGFSELSSFFHEDVVVVPPGFKTRAYGRDTCLKSYEDACSQMTFHKLGASEEQIEVYGSTAVVSYKYDCVWEYKDKQFEDDGHEIYVLSRNNREGWQIVWRTLIPGSRQTEACPMKAAEAGAQTTDVKQTCLDLMAASPVCHLTTIDGQGFPQTTAMLNLRCKKDYPEAAKFQAEQDNAFLLYMTTSMQSNKMKRMQANPKESAYFCDPDHIVGLMLGGEIELITDQALKNRIWQEGWTMYYPSGPEGPEYSVIKLAPKVVKGWRQNGPFEIELQEKD